MFMLIPDMFLSPEALERKRKREAAYIERRVKEAIPWDPKMRWQDHLTIKAGSYIVPIDPFPKLKPSRTYHPSQMKDSETYKESRNKNWRYVRQILPAKTIIWTASGNKRGNIMFDGDVIIPTLWHKKNNDKWASDPFMSMTPMEFFTLRAGIRLARSHTVVAGLGLGYQLMEVTRKRNVKKVTLIEIDKDLVDWMLPIVRPLLGDCELEVIIGDVDEILPTLTANTALVDIYEEYGNKGYEKRDLECKCKNITTIWVWGSAEFS
jgi:hypothetical protein